MKDYSELKIAAEQATQGLRVVTREWSDDDFEYQQEIFTVWSECETLEINIDGSFLGKDKADAEFIAAANPAAVLALIAENERYLKLVERMADQYVPLTELEGVPGWSRVVELVEVVAERDRLKTEVEGLRAQHCRDSAELRSLCQARDDARKERDQLKAEVERLNEDYDKAWRHDFNDKNNVQVLAAEVEVLRKDAERYRWLKSRPVLVPATGPDLAVWDDHAGDALRGDEADIAIDAAMSNKE